MIFVVKQLPAEANFGKADQILFCFLAFEIWLRDFFRHAEAALQQQVGPNGCKERTSSTILNVSDDIGGIRTRCKRLHAPIIGESVVFTRSCHVPVQPAPHPPEIVFADL